MNTPVFSLQPETLEDGLVKLVPVKANDFTRLFAAAADPAIWQFHPASNRYKPEVFQLFFDETVASKSAFVVLDQATKEAIGSTRFYDYQPQQASIAIGYTFLAKPYWGGAYNRAVKKLLLDYAFTFVNTVVFHIGITNLISQKAVAKLGALKSRALDFKHTGKEDYFEYKITKADWAKQQTSN